MKMVNFDLDYRSLTLRTVRVNRLKKDGRFSMVWNSDKPIYPVS